ncbi:MAG: TraM recognition domain-containing protein [Hungatella sp.]|jgi:type IV secretion system protein VirD4|nr:TraM recognition domain-containing protein [Hungatella sp.]
MGNYHARCGAGRKPEVFAPEAYLSLFGVVPDFKKKLATARSRQMGMCILFQNIPQLQNRYPDGQWEEILGGCDMSLFLGCNDMTTATYFSDRSGEITVGVSSVRKNYQTMRVSDYVPDYSESSSVGKRMLLLPDEVLRFPLDQALLIVRGQKVLRTRKFDYTRHPQSKKLKPEKTDIHVPEWSSEKEKHERQEEAQRIKPEISATGDFRPEEEPLSFSFHRKNQSQGGRNHEQRSYDRKASSGEEEHGKIEKVEDLFH